MDADELKKIVELHKKWIDSEPDGVKADLSGADLHNADLSGADFLKADFNGADLSNANFYNANLYGVNFYNSNLSNANLEGTYLADADLSYAILDGANLCKTTWFGAYLSDVHMSKVKLCNATFRHNNLRHADMRGAEISHSYLYDVDLQFADLSNANLTDSGLWSVDFRNANLVGVNLTNIRYDERTLGIIPVCPMEGSFIAYKKVEGKIVVLEIPADARRSSATTLKCRCDKAKVLRIENPDGSPAEINSVKADYVYTVGEITLADSFDEDCWNDSTGIDFFIAREMAVIQPDRRVLTAEELDKILSGITSGA